MIEIIINKKYQKKKSEDENISFSNGELFLKRLIKSINF